MKLTDINIDELSYAELGQLRDRTDQRMNALRHAGLPALRQRFIEEAAALGVTLDEVVGTTRKKLGRPRKPRPNGKDHTANAAAQPS